MLEWWEIYAWGESQHDLFSPHSHAKCFCFRICAHICIVCWWSYVGNLYISFVFISSFYIYFGDARHGLRYRIFRSAWCFCWILEVLFVSMHEGWVCLINIEVGFLSLSNTRHFTWFKYIDMGLQRRRPAFVRFFLSPHYQGAVSPDSQSVSQSSRHFVGQASGRSSQPAELTG